MFVVLVVDDDSDMRLLLRRQLSILGVDTIEASNGIEAQTIALSQNPPMMLLDILMPLQDGYETCHNLRQEKYTGTIILLSALPETEGQIKAAECGANAYIQKPLNREVLKYHLEDVRKRLGS